MSCLLKLEAKMKMVEPLEVCRVSHYPVCGIGRVAKREMRLYSKSLLCFSITHFWLLCWGVRNYRTAEWEDCFQVFLCSLDLPPLEFGLKNLFGGLPKMHSNPTCQLPGDCRHQDQPPTAQRLKGDPMELANYSLNLVFLSEEVKLNSLGLTKKGKHTHTPIESLYHLPLFISFLTSV